MEGRNIALKLMYNGTAYHGWQVQKNAVTVAETLEKALSTVVCHPVKCTGAGRTDAGVHAETYIANFRTSSSIPCDRIPLAVNTRLPRDVQEALDKARAEEPWPLAKNTLDLLWSNLAAAREEDLPICQDTGMACVFVELGTEVHIEGSFEAAIHEGVRRGYTDGYLRKSIVADPLRRGNTGDNTPAAITVHLVDGDGCTITVAPKGFGSENMSRIRMLKPADGVEGFKKFVVETVRLAGSNPCPPIVLGIGVGGSFDKVAYLAKKALLRPLDVPNPDPYYAALEGELLTAINALGIGPQGFGGKTTCLGLAIEQMPTHVAGLPVAVNVSCHVTRRASATL